MINRCNDAMMIWDIYSKIDMINMSAMMICNDDLRIYSKIYMINMSAMMIWDINCKIYMINMSAMMIWDINSKIDMGNMSFITLHHSILKWDLQRTAFSNFCTCFPNFSPKFDPLEVRCSFETPQTCWYGSLIYVYQTAKLYLKNSGL